MSEDPRRSSEGKHEFAVVGRPLPKIDAWAKVIGETKYADDLFLPRMAYGRLLRSPHGHARLRDRKSTRLNSSHLVMSYAVFCLKKKKTRPRRYTEWCSFTRPG